MNLVLPLLGLGAIALYYASREPEPAGKPSVVRVGAWDPSAELESASLYTESLGGRDHDLCASRLGLPAIAEIATAARRNLWSPALLPAIDNALETASVLRIGDYNGCGSYRLMLMKVRAAILALRGIGSSGIGPLFGPGYVSPRPRPLPYLTPQVYAPPAPLPRHPFRHPPASAPGVRTPAELYTLWQGSIRNRLPATVQRSLRLQYLAAIDAAAGGGDLPSSHVGPQASTPMPPAPTSAPGGLFVPTRGVPPIPNVFVPPLH